MLTTSFAWLSLLFLLFWLHDVYSEKLQFVKTPPTREILPVGSNLTIDCTTNNATAQTAVYYRRSVKRVKWKKIEAVPGIKVAQMGSVYILRALSRRNKGQYQCRASGGGTNSTETTWPENVGIVIIRGTLQEKRKSDSKVKERKKIKNKKTANKKPGQKKPKRKKPRNKKKRINRKRPGKRRPGSRKPGTKRPGTKRPGAKRPGNKRPGNKRPGSKRPGNKRPGNKRPGNKRPGNKRPGNKRPGHKIGGGGKKPGKKDPGPKKIKVLLKALKNLVTVNESSLAVLKCTARVQGGQPAIMSWHRSGKMIGCSTKDLRRCSSASPGRYRFTYKTYNTTRDGSRKKYITYLRIPQTRRARDKGIYVCMVTDKQGKPLTTRQTIRLKIVRKRAS